MPDLMSASENVWEGRTAGVKLVRASLLLRLSQGENAIQQLEEKRGTYFKKLKGWLLDFRNLKMIPCNPSGSWLNVEAEFAVFKPVPGLQLSTTFLNLDGDDGKALCQLVSVTSTLIIRYVIRAVQLKGTGKLFINSVSLVDF